MLKPWKPLLKRIKAEVKTLGKRGVQHKGTGWSGAGSMTIYYVTSIFRKMATEICKDRSRHLFQLQ